MFTIAPNGIYRATVIAAVVMALLAGSASAALQVYEGFDYADGTDLNTQAGGTGWATAWANTNAATESATTPGLSYPGLAVTGNKATIIATQTTGNGANAFIPRDTTATYGTDGTTIWISALGQRMGPKGGATPQYERVFSIAFFNGATENFSIGELSSDALDVWGLNPTTAVADTQHSTVPIDTLAFLLLKIDYLAGNDNASMWVNPNLSLGEAGLGTPQATISDPDMTFNRVRLSAGASQTSGLLAAQGLWDEFRIGDTFADVAPAGAATDADFNGDLKVDGNDFLIWQRGIATSGGDNTNGDTDTNQTVDGVDLGNIKQKFGGAPAVVAVGAVPEPASCVLLAMGPLVMAGRRRRA